MDSPTAGQSVPTCAIEVRGRASDGEGPVQVTVNGLAVETTADGSFTANASLATGDPGLVEVVATDRFGNSARAAVRVNVVAPTVGLTSLAPGARVGSRYVDLLGTSGNGTEVTVNGRPAEVLGDGTWRLLRFDLGGTDGIVELALVSRHCASSATATAVLELDTTPADSTPPEISTLTPAPGTFASSRPAVSASLLDADSGIDPTSPVLRLDGMEVTPDAVVSPAGVGWGPREPLVEGVHILELSVADLAGNRSSASWSFTVDVTPPSLSVVEPAGDVVTGDPTPPVVVTFADELSGIDLATLAIAVDSIDVTPSCAVMTARAECTSPPLGHSRHAVAVGVRAVRATCSWRRGLSRCRWMRRLPWLPSLRLRMARRSERRP